MPKPRIAVLTTGGTIVSVSSSALEMNNYGQLAGFTSLSSQDLLASIPCIEAHADITVFPVTDIGSARMGFDAWIKIVRCIEDLDRRDSADGFVITHGTDTLEETAYFLSLVLKTEKPVILTGAMRPSTGLSADGPMNLAGAICLAASSEARAMGVLVLMNDTISSAFSVQKTNTTNVATFRNPGLGFLGFMQDCKPFFFTRPLKAQTRKTPFFIDDFIPFPRVDVNFCTLGSDGKLIEAMVACGTQGIVNAGVGHANMSVSVREALAHAAREGIPVVLTSRVASGIVTPVEKFAPYGFVAGYMHTPQKARILLAAALTKTHERAGIQEIFETY